MIHVTAQNVLHALIASAVPIIVRTFLFVMTVAVNVLAVHMALVMKIAVSLSVSHLRGKIDRCV
jgi:hypothetical protein